VQDGRPRFAVDEAARRRLIDAYLAAAQAGDTASLLRVLAPDATFTSDGGGKVRAARNVLFGADRIARFAVGVAPKTPPGLAQRWLRINGALAQVSYLDGRPWGTLSFDTDGTRITAIYRVLNPEKLAHLPGPD
jgi:RNA polymerase sigma-70 factor (ECF subfamily)